MRFGGYLPTFVLGVGPGWDQHEFETLGMRLGERGRRTGVLGTCADDLDQLERCASEIVAPFKST